MFNILKKKLNTVVEKVSGTAKELPKKITEKELSEKDVSNILVDLELELLQADVALEVSDKIKENIKEDLVGKKIKRGKLEDKVKNSIRETLLEILDIPEVDLRKKIESKSPFTILFMGFNGSGKTTTLAKMGYNFKQDGYSCVFAAGDSFRAAAIEQLEKHGENLGIKVIKHKKGSDSAAVIYDAIQHAKAKDIDIVLADSAGRMHTNQNLMDELKKIVRVNKPDFKILVIDSITGNDAVEQAKKFDDDVGIDGVFLTKIDVNEKGGAILSVCEILDKPIVGLGVGQSYDDVKEFDKKKFIDNLL